MVVPKVETFIADKGCVGGNMSVKSNVIDIRGQLKTRQKGAKKSQSETVTNTKAETPVIDFTERRLAHVNQERRKVRRTLLSELVGVSLMIPNLGLQQTSLYDISDDGLSFDLPYEFGEFNIGDVINVRIYLNSKNYFSFDVKITHKRQVPEEGIRRHGATFQSHHKNDEAIFFFIRFIEAASRSLKSDSGDPLFSVPSRS